MRTPPRFHRVQENPQPPKQKQMMMIDIDRRLRGVRARLPPPPIGVVVEMKILVLGDASSCGWLINALLRDYYVPAVVPTVVPAPTKKPSNTPHPVACVYEFRLYHHKNIADVTSGEQVVLDSSVNNDKKKNQDGGNVENRSSSSGIHSCSNCDDDCGDDDDDAWSEWPSFRMQDDHDDEDVPTDNVDDYHCCPYDCYRTADSIRQEIIADNNNNNNHSDHQPPNMITPTTTTTSSSSSSAIQVKTFNIQINEPLCEMMNTNNKQHHDGEDNDNTVQLVLVHVPDVFATTTNKQQQEYYQDYVTDNWESLECAIVVLDASTPKTADRAGCDGCDGDGDGDGGDRMMNQQQLQLLEELIQRNNAQIKDIPVIVLLDYGNVHKNKDAGNNDNRIDNHDSENDSSMGQVKLSELFSAASLSCPTTTSSGVTQQQQLLLQQQVERIFLRAPPDHKQAKQTKKEDATRMPLRQATATTTTTTFTAQTLTGTSTSTTKSAAITDDKEIPQQQQEESCNGQQPIASNLTRDHLPSLSSSPLPKIRFPVVIPTSTLLAFVYRTLAKNNSNNNKNSGITSLEEFQNKFHKDANLQNLIPLLLDKLLRSETKQWSNLIRNTSNNNTSDIHDNGTSPDEQMLLSLLYHVLFVEHDENDNDNDQDDQNFYDQQPQQTTAARFLSKQNRQRFRASSSTNNLDAILHALSCAVGGADRQRQLIQRQIDRAFQSLLLLSSSTSTSSSSTSSSKSPSSSLRAVPAPNSTKKSRTPTSNDNNNRFTTVKKKYVVALVRSIYEKQRILERSEKNLGQQPQRQQQQQQQEILTAYNNDSTGNTIISNETLMAAFWKAFTVGCESWALQLLAQSPRQVDALAWPMTQLLDYYQFVGARMRDDKDDDGDVDTDNHVWEHEQEQTMVRMKTLVRRQIKIILSEDARVPTNAADGGAAMSRRKKNRKHAPNDGSSDTLGGVDITWSSLHPMDLRGICQSILLLSYDKHFCQVFGQEKMMLEDAAHHWMVAASAALQQVSIDFGHCPECRTVKLNFNRYCNVCKSFYMPECCVSCGNQLFFSQESCGSCGTQISRFSYPYAILQHESFRLYCPICSGPLCYNRRCGSCDVYFYLKQDNANSSLGVGNVNNNCCCCCNEGSLRSDGRCGNSPHKCGYTHLVQKEFPLSMRELLSLTYDEGSDMWKPKYPKTYYSCRCLDIPTSLSDPKHFGHVTWLYCQFLASLDQN